MSRNQLIVAVIVAAVVTAIMDLLINVAATQLQPLFEGRAWLLTLLLVAVFLLSLFLAIYMLRARSANGAGIKVSDKVTENGRIEGSPVRINKEAQAEVNREASKGGKIKNSGTTIE